MSEMAEWTFFAVVPSSCYTDAPELLDTVSLNSCHLLSRILYFAKNDQCNVTTLKRMIILYKMPHYVYVN
jgi:hypothetical protein